MLDSLFPVYIFTSILAGEKKRAEKALKEWKGSVNIKNSLLRLGLVVAKYMPAKVNHFIYGIRLKVF